MSESWKQRWYSKHRPEDFNEASTWNFHITCDWNQRGKILRNEQRIKKYRCLIYMEGRVPCKLEIKTVSTIRSGINHIRGMVEFQRLYNGAWVRIQLRRYLCGGDCMGIYTWAFGTRRVSGMPHGRIATGRAARAQIIHDAFTRPPAQTRDHTMERLTREGWTILHNPDGTDSIVRMTDYFPTGHFFTDQN